MTNISRRYYERELGAGMGPNPAMDEAFGYSEPLRRFIQRESFEPQANEIRNTMPSWLPGDDYMTNFKVGDSYVRVDDGYARLPGTGYAAIHPELKDVNPEDYPDIHKLSILADVAPYSREYNQVSPSCLTQKTSRTRQAEAGLPFPSLPYRAGGLARRRYDTGSNWLNRQTWRVGLLRPAGSITPRARAGEGSRLHGWFCSSAASDAGYDRALALPS